MPRITPQDLVSPELTQVKAAPVSTLTAPGITPPAQTNSFLQLANALSGMQPSLNRFLDRKMDQVTKEDILAGQQAQLKNKMAFKDAVKTGQVPAGANPWFVQGYQEQEQRINGVAFDQSMRTAWANSEIRNSDDPMAFKSWMQDYTAKYVEDNKLGGSPMFSVFQETASASQHNLAAQHIGYRQQAIEQRVQDGAQTLINNVLDYPLVYNGADGQIGAIKSIVNMHVANGLNPTLANKLVVDSIVEKAKATGSISDLDMVGMIDFGNGSLGKTQYAREQVDAAERSIASDLHGRHAADRIAAKAHAEEAMDDIGRRYIEASQKEPGASVDAYISEAIKAGCPPEKIKELWGLRTASLTDQKSINEDPAFVGDLGWRSQNGQASPSEILTALSGNRITIATATRLQENLKDNRNSILRDPFVQQQIDGVYRQYVAGDTTDTTTISKANAIRSALSAEAMKLSTEGKSPLEIASALMDKAVKLQEYANFNTKTNSSPDALDKGSRKAVTAIDASTKDNLKKADGGAPKEPAPAPKPAEPAKPLIKGYTSDELQALYKQFQESKKQTPKK